MSGDKNSPEIIYAYKVAFETLQWHLGQWFNFNNIKTPLVLIGMWEGASLSNLLQVW